MPWVYLKLNLKQGRGPRNTTSRYYCAEADDHGDVSAGQLQQRHGSSRLEDGDGDTSSVVQHTARSIDSNSGVHAHGRMKSDEAQLQGIKPPPRFLQTSGAEVGHRCDSACRFDP